VGDTWATVLGASGAAAGAIAAIFMYLGERGARGAARRTKAIEDLVHAGLEPLTLRDKDVAATLTALAASISQLSQDVAKIRERLEVAVDRTTVLETKMEVFWRNVSLDVAKVLHSPNPARQHLDLLLEDLMNGGLDDARDRAELRGLLRTIRDYHHGDPSDFPIYPGDQVAAAILLHTMDL
jgi:hypothetical protein